MRRPSVPDKPSLEEKRARLARSLEVMRLEFERGLPARIAELRAAIAGYRPDAGRGQPAEVAAHSLCGIAGSFGRPALTEAAAQLEELLKSSLGTLAEEWPARSQRIAGVFAELELAASAPPAPAAP
jgi:HPt (histidine-containing phosphotransfer) domain-containing protein